MGDNTLVVTLVCAFCRADPRMRALSTSMAR
jgi:hypothetical protein